MLFVRCGLHADGIRTYIALRRSKNRCRLLVILALVRALEEEVGDLLAALTASLYFFVILPKPKLLVVLLLRGIR